MSRLILALLIFAGCAARTDSSTSPVAGTYHVYKKETLERLDNGWTIDREHERLLILNADSTYTDENNSFAHFDWPDYTGTWSISGNFVVLRYFDPFQNSNATEMLMIGRSGYLWIIEDGFLKGSFLERKSPGWKRHESEMRSAGKSNP